MSDPPPRPEDEVCVTASHDALFEDEGERCEMCGCELAPGEDSGEHPAGRAALVWVRGEERREQEAPLCPECATTVGVTALRAWEVEEDEG